MLTSKLTLLLILTFVIGAKNAKLGKKFNPFQWRWGCNKNKVKCKIFDPENGKLEMKFKLDVKCDDGFAKSPADTTKILCIDGGETKVPNCVRDCGILQDPVNGKVTYTTTVLDSVAAYHCDEGFVLSGGDQQRTCQINGDWSGSEPQCINNIVCPGDSVPSEFGQVCCPLSCGGQCGGPDCATYTGGQQNCCELNILNQNVSCKDSPAPCVLKPFPDEFHFLLDQFSQNENVDSEIAALKNELAALKATVVQINMLGPLKNDVELLKAQMTNSQNDLNTVQTDLQTAKSDISVTKNDVDNLENQADEAKADIGQVQSDIVTIQAEVSTVQNKADMATNAAASVKNGLETVKTEVQGLDARLTTVEGEVDTLKSGASDLTGVKSDLETVKSDVASAKSSISGINTQITTIGTSVTDNSNDITSLKSQNTQLMTTQSDIEAALQTSFSVRSPFLAVRYIIALQGVFPSRNRRKRSIGGDAGIGEVAIFAGNFAPRGWAFCDGQLLSIASNSALFSLLGTTYGGDGQSTFGLPDLRGRSAIHVGNGPGLSPISQGQKGGAETHTIKP